MDREGGCERARGLAMPRERKAGPDPARSHDAGDGWISAGRHVAEGVSVARHPGHRRHRDGLELRRPRTPEFRNRNRAGEGHVPAGRAGRPHPHARRRSATGRRHGGSCAVTPAKTNGADFLTRHARARPAHPSKTRFNTIRWIAGSSPIAVNMSERDPVVRDASLRDAPHHEDRCNRPHPEGAPKGRVSKDRGRSLWLSLILAPLGSSAAMTTSRVSAVGIKRAGPPIAACYGR